MVCVRGEADRHRPFGPFRIANQGFCGFYSAIPIRRRRPTVIDDHHQRSCARQRIVARVHHGIGQRENNSRGQSHAQQRQPPRTFRGRFFPLQHGGEDFQRRKDFRLRTWRSEPQQPPYGWQGQKTEENVGTGKNERQKAHRRPPPSAGDPDRYIWTATSASEARWSVRWKTKFQPRRRSDDDKASRRARYARV